MVATKIRAKFGTAFGTDHTGVGASYALLGTLSTSALALYVSSSLNDTCFLSFDGVNDHLFIGSGGGGGANAASILETIDIGANKQDNGRLEIAKGTSVYVKQGPDGAPSAGDIYISYMYAE